MINISIYIVPTIAVLCLFGCKSDDEIELEPQSEHADFEDRVLTCKKLLDDVNRFEVCRPVNWEVAETKDLTLHIREPFDYSSEKPLRTNFTVEIFEARTVDQVLDSLLFTWDSMYKNYETVKLDTINDPNKISIYSMGELKISIFWIKAKWRVDLINCRDNVFKLTSLTSQDKWESSFWMINQIFESFEILDDL